jgi:YfiH family protein
MLTAALLDNVAGIRHGFFTRAGGVSEGIYASLNCGLGSGDRAEHVAANRGRAMQQLDAGADALVTLHQIHSPTVVEVERPWGPGAGPKADGMVTAKSGVVLGILTADCAPVLFADSEAGVIGAAHAGWRGAVGGVVEATVAAMVALGAAPGRIVAAVGPCIAQRSYEVGPEFPAPFLADDAANRRFFQPAARVGHFQFDLRGYVAERLRRAQVTQLSLLNHDTVSSPDFFSYRRACLNREPDYGRGLSAIALAP